MKKLFTLLVAATLLSITLNAQVYLRGDFNGFGTTDVMNLRGAAHSITKTGISGNNQFKIANSDYTAPNLGKGSGAVINTKDTWFNGGGNTTLTFTSSNYYTVNRVGTSVGILETTFNPVTIPTVTRTPSGATVASNIPIVVNITTSGTPDASEIVTVRWTTNSFSTSTNSTATGSGTNWSFSIPAQASGTTVNFYVFTAKSSPSFTTGDTDFFTLQLNNNSNSNYSYTTSSVLAVETANIEAKKVNNTTSLTWLTSSEKDNALFQIERSANGTDFSPIGEVKGAGNSAAAKNYAFTDATPLSGTNYYRLKAVDYNGAATLSKVVSVNFSSKNDGKIAVYPNPTRNVLSVDVNATEASTTLVQVSDLMGRVVLSQSVSVNKGANLLPLNVTSLPSGTYFVKVNGDVMRFVKQ
jgi:hypothetical protein